LFQRPPPLPASTTVPAVLPSPPTARLWRSVTRVRSRLTGPPDVFPAEVAIPPPTPVPTNSKVALAPSPRLPLPPRASVNRKGLARTVAVRLLFRPPPNAVPISAPPPVLVLLEPPRARLPVTVLPVRQSVPLSALKMPAPAAGPTRGPLRVLLEPPRAR